MRTLRSSLRRLFPIERTLRACATITSCPNSHNHRLTHGECIPVSSATNGQSIEQLAEAENKVVLELLALRAKAGRILP
jgi:hypothetical protein